MNLRNHPIAIQVRRRFGTPDEEARIYEILKDEFSMVNPSYFINGDKFYDFIVDQVTVTYLLDFYDSENEVSFSTMYQYVRERIADDWGDTIKEYWLNEI